MPRFMIAALTVCVGLALYSEQCHQIRADAATQAAYTALDKPAVPTPGPAQLFDDAPQAFVPAEVPPDVVCSNGGCAVQKVERVQRTGPVRRVIQRWRERDRRFYLFPLFRRR